MSKAHITLVLGGARSGKSSFAENLAIQSGLSRVYLATAEAFDQEMKNRISRHQEERGSGWTTIEEPVELVQALKNNANENAVILVDCLTLWLSNLMGQDMELNAAFSEFFDCLEELEGSVIFVSNEVGQGIVPDNKMARDFRDMAGRLHQMLAEKANDVYFITAGLSQKLK